MNTFIAVFTTSNARIRLYNELKRLDRNVIYYDTDSLVYIYHANDKNQIHPPYGSFLGEWTNEFKEGTHISEFISAGPKSYAYKTSDGEIVVKVKGLTLTYAATRLINFDSIKALVLRYACPEEYQPPDEVNELVIQYPSKIHRDRYNFRLYGKDVNKKFRVTYGKRQLIRDGNFDTQPFGY